MTFSQNITENLINLHESIMHEAKLAHRAPSDIQLTAVSKKFDAKYILPILRAGHKYFGENQVQEAEEKWPALKLQFPLTRLHLIGALQSNKVHRAVALFDVIETIDRFKIAQRIAKEMKTQKRNISCYVQINTGEENQKAGILPIDADVFIQKCREEIVLPIEGLMCIPPMGKSPDEHFTLLSEIAKRNKLKYLSMGMSGDFRKAIKFGATNLRVGTAIFGDRKG